MSKFPALRALPLPNLSEFYDYLKTIENYIHEPRPPHLMTIGTLTIAYFLYHNYWAIFKEKQRRKARSDESNLDISVAHHYRSSSKTNQTSTIKSKSKSKSKSNLNPPHQNLLPVSIPVPTDTHRLSVVHTDKEREAVEQPHHSLLYRLLFFDGIFDNTKSLDRILSALWIPSIERGLSVMKNRNTRRHPTLWHYSDALHTPIPKTKASDLTTSVLSNPDFPLHLKYLMKLCRVFGHWTLHDIKRLHSKVEYTTIKAGSNLFSIKESDDKVYIVMTGILQLKFQGDEDGEFHPIKKIRGGDQILSLMSFIDFIMDKKGTYRTVETEALVESTVMKIPMSGIRDILCPDCPEGGTIAKGLQRVLRRTYEVVFTAFHRILGLTQELIREMPRLPIKSLEDIPLLEKPSQEICDQVAEALLEKFGLSSDERSLIEECSVLTVPPNFVVFEPGHNDNKAVVYVFAGELEVSLRVPRVPASHSFNLPGNSRTRVHEMERIFYINAGEIFGSLVFLTDDGRQFNVKTSCKSIIVHIPETTLNNVLGLNPMIVVPLIDSIFQRLSPFARQMDFGIEWTYVESGQTLFKTNEESLATFLVLNGRLRSYHHNMVLLGEYGKYDFVGLVEMWTNRRRTKTVLAVRDTELAKIPRDFIFYIAKRFSKVGFQVLHYLTERVVSSYKTSTDLSSMLNIDDNFESASSRCTFALFPTSKDVPISYIAKEFATQYERFGTVLLLNSDGVKSHFGQDIFAAGNIHANMTGWLSALEARYRRILYVADPTPTEWSVKCLHQADMIFIVVNEDGNKKVSNIEQMIMNGDSLAKKELLICHKDQTFNTQPKQARRTRLWLQNRSWLSFHHHIWVDSAYYNMTSEYIIQQIDFDSKKRNSDIARIVRWLTGNTFGLALGGGGAKGAAHIGFLKEFCKYVVPIDMICGVSIGSFIGALYAAYQDMDKVEKIAKNWFFQVSDGVKYTMDLTLPFVSFFKGDSLNYSLIEIFGDIQIEDLRIPFFICSTDLTNNSIREHRYGSLWRYVRASMTLINFFPPLCDPEDGHYLIDGGYMNLVPADIMRRLGVKYIMAVDISSKNNTYRSTNYGDSISGFNLLSHTLPLFSQVSVPSMMEIQSRLNWAQSVVYLNLVKKLEAFRSADSPSIIYIRLPIDLQTTSDFKRFDKIRDIGKMFARRVLVNISPSDNVDLIWEKLRYNRGTHRFGSISIDSTIDDYMNYPYPTGSQNPNEMQKAKSETPGDAESIISDNFSTRTSISSQGGEGGGGSRRSSKDQTSSTVDLNATSLNLYSSSLASDNKFESNY